jgi:NADPH:quinone reductase-like Zn-dependent oxidoreductase
MTATHQTVLEVNHMSRVTLTSLIAVLAPLLLQPVQGAADSFKRYELRKSGQQLQLTIQELPQRSPGPDEVLVRVRAVALNHRDLYVLQGFYPGVKEGRVPVSDGAGEVVAVGTNVQRFKPGDRVVGTFFERWVSGKPSRAAFASARGGESDGMLAQFIVSHQEGLVKFPAHLSFEEAATLPCAGVTAWNGLFTKGSMQAGQFVLLEGTGGVSIFGLQFAAAAGAKPIITSSSDEKLARARALGAVGAVNYRTNADWEKEVRRLTNDAGIDQVLEVGGKDTVEKAAASLGMGGHIALIGGLTGFGGNLPVTAITSRGASVSSIFVGSRADFEAMNAFIERYKIKPVIDRVFEFDAAAAAFDYLKSGSHFGKIVIKL